MKKHETHNCYMGNCSTFIYFSLANRFNLYSNSYLFDR